MTINFVLLHGDAGPNCKCDRSQSFGVRGEFTYGDAPTHLVITTQLTLKAWFIDDWRTIMQA